MCPGHFKLKVCFNCIVCTLAEKGWVEKISVKLKITRALPGSSLVKDKETVVQSIS